MVGGSAAFGLDGEKMVKGFWNASTKDDHVDVAADFAGWSVAVAAASDEAAAVAGGAVAGAYDEIQGVAVAAGSMLG
jgi:hypothetical protein